MALWVCAGSSGCEHASPGTTNAGLSRGSQGAATRQSCLCAGSGPAFPELGNCLVEEPVWGMGRGVQEPQGIEAAQALASHCIKEKFWQAKGSLNQRRHPHSHWLKKREVIFHNFVSIFTAGGRQGGDPRWCPPLAW